MNILLIHDSKIARMIVQSYIETEFSEAIADIAESADKGVALLESYQYDIVLCGREMEAMNGEDVFERMRESTINSDCAFILMTASYNDRKVAMLADRGIEYVLPIPCTALQVKEQICLAVDPREARVHARYVISGTSLNIEIAEAQFTAKVVNISQKGVLCELLCQDSPPNLLQGSQLTVCFPENYGNVLVRDIEASLLRLKARSWHENGAIKILRAVWHFDHLPSTAENTLKIILEQARKDMLEIEAEAQNLRKK